MALTTGGSSGATAEINVTPLIDVLLVLLIIFMIIVPITPNGLAALLPQASKGSPTAAPAPPVIVQVQSDVGGTVRYLLNQQRVEKTELAQALSRIMASRQDKVMFVRGDRELEFAAVAEVISMGHLANAQRIGVLTTGVDAGK